MSSAAPTAHVITVAERIDQELKHIEGISRYIEIGIHAQLEAFNQREKARRNRDIYDSLAAYELDEDAKTRAIQAYQYLYEAHGEVVEKMRVAVRALRSHRADRKPILERLIQLVGDSSTETMPYISSGADEMPCDCTLRGGHRAGVLAQGDVEHLAEVARNAEATGGNLASSRLADIHDSRTTTAAIRARLAQTDRELEAVASNRHRLLCQAATEARNAHNAEEALAGLAGRLSIDKRAVQGSDTAAAAAGSGTVYETAENTAL